MSQFLSLHEVELKPDASELEFQQVVYQELAPYYRAIGCEVRLLKGDRGKRDGKYLLILEMQSPAERDRWFPSVGQLSEEGLKVFAPSGTVWEKIGRLTSKLIDPDFTDYLMVET